MFRTDKSCQTKQGIGYISIDIQRQKSFYFTLRSQSHQNKLQRLTVSSTRRIQTLHRSYFALEYTFSSSDAKLAWEERMEMFEHTFVCKTAR